MILREIILWIRKSRMEKKVTDRTQRGYHILFSLVLGPSVLVKIQSYHSTLGLEYRFYKPAPKPAPALEVPVESNRYRHRHRHFQTGTGTGT